MYALTPEQSAAVREIAIEVVTAAFEVAAEQAAKPLRLCPSWIEAEVAARARSVEEGREADVA